MAYVKSPVGESLSRKRTPPFVLPFASKVVDICVMSTYLCVTSLYTTPIRPTQPASSREAIREKASPLTSLDGGIASGVDRSATSFSKFQFTRSFDEYTLIDANVARGCLRVGDTA